ncbi:MAG: hypothetical protein ACKV0T_25535 [Planctomycetales bacterium]
MFRSFTNLSSRKSPIVGRVLVLAGLVLCVGQETAWCGGRKRPVIDRVSQSQTVPSATAEAAAPAGPNGQSLPAPASAPASGSVPRVETDDDDGEELGPYGSVVESILRPAGGMYRRRSERDLLVDQRQIFEQHKAKERFLIPRAADRFERVDAPTLGASWFQNRLSGAPGEPPEDADGKPDRKIDLELTPRGDMQIVRRQGLLPAGKREASVLNEWVGSRNLRAEVKIWLQAPNNRFGLLFFADNPNSSPDRENQWEANTFHYVLASATEMVVARRARGVETILARARLEPELEFTLHIAVLDGKLRVFRNEREVALEYVDADPARQRLTVGRGSSRGADPLDAGARSRLDTTQTGQYLGVLGEAHEAPILFDDLLAEAYAGQHAPRTFAARWRGYPAPGVRYWPIYYEQVGIERYGHHVGNVLQPPLEHAAFMVDTILLPWNVLRAPPWACHSDIGLYKPGDVVLPFRWSYPEW